MSPLPLGKKFFADAVKDLDVRRSCWIVWVGPTSYDTCLCKRKAERD